MADYLKPVLATIQRTANSPKGFRAIVKDIQTTLDRADEEIADLVTQRSTLADLLGHYATLYRVIAGEALVSSRDLREYQTPPPEAVLEDNLRDTVLSLAKSLARGGMIEDQRILTSLRRRREEIPWRNPKAVIGTILSRSKLWEKTKPGIYKLVKDDEAGA